MHLAHSGIKALFLAVVLLSVSHSAAQEGYLPSTILVPMPLEELQPLTLENSQYLVKLTELRHINLYGQWETVYATAFSPDGNLLATSTVDTIRLWDVARGEIMKSLTTFERLPFKHLAFSPDGSTLAASSGGRQIAFFDIPTGVEKLTATWNPGFVSDISFSLDSQLLAVNSDHESGLIDAETGEILQTVDVGWRNADITFSADGMYAAVGGYLWNVQTGEYKVIEDPNDIFPINGAFTSDNSTLVVLGAHGIAFWDNVYETPSLLNIIRFDGWNSESHLIITPDGTVIILERSSFFPFPTNIWLSSVDSPNSFLHVLSLASGEPEYTTSVNLDGTLVAASTDDGIISLYGIPRCAVRASIDANLRAGPSTSEDVLGSLPAGWILFVTGQAQDQEGRIWWQLSNDRWVRTDVVEQLGSECAVTPQFQS